MNSAVSRTATVIPFVAPRRIAAVLPRDPDEDRRLARERLQRALPPGSIVYVVRRWFNPGNDWLICDFFRIERHDVTCITRDVALAIDRFDPEREIGVKLQRRAGQDPLTALIDGVLARALHGEPGAVQHLVIM